MTRIGLSERDWRVTSSYLTQGRRSGNGSGSSQLHGAGFLGWSCHTTAQRHVPVDWSTEHLSTLVLLAPHPAGPFQLTPLRRYCTCTDLPTFLSLCPVFVFYLSAPSPSHPNRTPISIHLHHRYRPSDCPARPDPVVRNHEDRHVNAVRRRRVSCHLPAAGTTCPVGRL